MIEASFRNNNYIIVNIGYFQTSFALIPSNTNDKQPIFQKYTVNDDN